MGKHLFDQLIDQYQLQEHIRQSGATDVYRAFDVDEDKPVALEILFPSFSKQEETQFTERTKVLAHLYHPNIARIHQAGVTSHQRPYVARDFIDGFPLSERLEQISSQPESVNTIYALKLLRQIASALAVVERHHIFHYHLSPSNIMLKLDGNIVLVDLVVPPVKMPARVMANTLSEQAYLSPEQRQGKQINSRSQVYSLGAILYRMLTGHAPAKPKPFWHSFRQTTPSQNVSLRQIRPDLADETNSLIDKCLRYTPWTRFRTIRQLVTAIDNAIQAERLLVQTSTTPEIQLPYSRPSRVFIIPTFLILLGIGLSIMIFQFQAEPASESVAEIVPDVSPVNTIGGIAGSGFGTSESKPVTATAVTIPTPTFGATPANNAITTEIEIVEPDIRHSYEIGEQAVFSWVWPTELEAGQQFSVYLINENGESLLGTVTEEDDENIYRFETSTAIADTAGIYQWRIALVDTQSRTRLAESQLYYLEIMGPTLTPTTTMTPAATITSTIISTPTPVTVATDTPEPSPTPTETATATPTATPTSTPQPTDTPIPPTETPISPTPPPPTPTSPQPPTPSPPPPPTATPPPPP